MPRVATTQRTYTKHTPIGVTCSTCFAHFSVQRELIRHAEIHDDKTKNRFRCEHSGCDYATRQKANYETHVKNVHLKIKDIACDYCEFVTGARASLIHHHKRKHSGLPRTPPKSGRKSVDSSQSSSSSSSSPSPFWPLSSASSSSSSSSPSPAPKETVSEDIDAPYYFAETHTVLEAKDMFPAVQDLSSLSMELQIPSIDWQWDWMNQDPFGLLSEPHGVLGFDDAYFAHISPDSPTSDYSSDCGLYMPSPPHFSSPQPWESSTLTPFC